MAKRRSHKFHVVRNTRYAIIILNLLTLHYNRQGKRVGWSLNIGPYRWDARTRQHSWRLFGPSRWTSKPRPQRSKYFTITVLSYSIITVMVCTVIVNATR